MLTIIVATDQKGLIGREERIPWRIRDDLVQLRNKTKDRPVILGRKTYDSMAWYYKDKKMPGKVYIVVTRNTSYQPERDNVVVVHSIEEAMQRAKKYSSDEVPVIGGGSIYREMLPYVGRIYITEVQTVGKGDVYFPELNADDWREVAREHHQKDDRNEYDFDFVTLERNR